MTGRWSTPSEPPRPTDGWVEIDGTRTFAAADFCVRTWPAPYESGRSTASLHYSTDATFPHESRPAIRITLWHVYAVAYHGFDVPIDDDEGPPGRFAFSVTDDSRFRSRFVDHPRTASKFGPQGFAHVDRLRHYHVSVDDLGSWDFLAIAARFEPFVTPPLGRPDSKDWEAEARCVERVARDTLGPVSVEPPGEVHDTFGAT